MKMDNNICSTIDGIVKDINIKTGQSVSKNDVLIDIEKVEEIVLQPQQLSKK
jgi:biotin carboxyl carrier protein